MRFTAYIITIFLLLTACGNSNKKEQQNQSDDASVQQTKTKDQDVRTIDIIGIDNMKYVVKEEGQRIGTGETIKTSSGDSYLLLQNIEASPGEKLHIRLTTISNLPASAMSHDWILLKMGVDPEKFDQAAIKAKDNDYIPQDKTDDIIAHTGLAGGGETVETTFTVPQRTGDYDYLCSFPGHFAAGMKGTLIVQ